MSDNQSMVNPNWSSKSILIVEDDKFNAFIIVSFIQKTQAKFEVADTGEKAVELALLNKPDLILMDIKLPCINGLEATRQIKSVLPNTTIIAQTAYATESDRDEAFKAGCSDFITKPIREQKLISIISKYF